MQIYNAGTMPVMPGKLFTGSSLPETIHWAEEQLAGFVHQAIRWTLPYERPPPNLPRPAGEGSRASGWRLFKSGDNRT